MFANQNHSTIKNTPQPCNGLRSVSPHEESAALFPHSKIFYFNIYMVFFINGKQSTTQSFK